MAACPKIQACSRGSFSERCLNEVLFTSQSSALVVAGTASWIKVEDIYWHIRHLYMNYYRVLTSWDSTLVKILAKDLGGYGGRKLSSGSLFLSSIQMSERRSEK
jgi:hypothetical protein